VWVRPSPEVEDNEETPHRAPYHGLHRRHSSLSRDRGNEIG
jgi:hypothetical protein